MIKWKPETRKVKDLKNWSKNPRKIKHEDFERLKERISKRGFHDVIKIDTDNTILSGHQRKNALLSLGIEEVLVLVPERKLTVQEQDEVGIESNRNDGQFDFDILGNEFDLDMLKDLGFSETELGLIDNEALGDTFDLPSTEKGKLEQITFTLSKPQLEAIKEVLKALKDTDEYKGLDLDENSNSNGNLLYVMALICQQKI